MIALARQARNGFHLLLVLMLVFFAVHGLVVVSDYVGYASFSGQAGNIYQLVIKHHVPVQNWAGVYGVGVRVDGYNFQQTETYAGGDVVGDNFLFDCLEPDIPHEIYASVYDPNLLDLNSVTPATPAEIDTFYGLNSSGFDSAANTFVANVSFLLGSLTITAPGTYTYKIDETGTPATFATVALKDGSGRIFFGALLTNFTLGFNGDVINYQLLLPMFNNQTSTTYNFFTDPNDQCPAGQGTEPLTGNVIGNVSNQGGTRLENVIVDVVGTTDLSDATGFYNLSPPSGTWRIYAIKEGYKVYYNNITVIENVTVVHDITMIEDLTNPNTDVGPGQDNPGDSTQNNIDVGPGPGQDVGPGEAPPVPFVEEPKTIEGQDYIISLSEIKHKIRIDTFLQQSLYIYSFKDYPVALSFTLTGDNMTGIFQLDKTSMTLAPDSNDHLIITIFGRPPVGTYYGNLTIDGEINATIPVEIEILPKDRIPVEALLLNLETNDKRVLPGDAFKFKTDLRNLLIDQPYPVQLLFTIQPLDGNSTVWSYQTNVYLKTAFSLIRTVELPADTAPGDYILRVSANYLTLSSSTSTIFQVDVPFWSRTAFGLRYWMWLLIVLGLLALAGAGYWYWKTQEAKKKYHLKVDYNELPKPGPRNIPVGKIAETENKTYFNLENFKVHTIVAGSTGGGKSVSAQVIVEEALERDVAVIVFDPTAQWTGMLRPCKDKVMLSLYPLYGLKKTDARGYNGNVRMITNPREIIDIKKYVKPGEIQIFAGHKLDPKDMDLVVANAIREIFHANFQENKLLKVLFVFDEVHRLLPKFGGSGDGFLQIERGCREFRKWGLGVVLVSQVLSDFMGTIKANINTEIQMRTRDEGDLERIRVKYGDEVLRSLVKATVGTGMVENPAYNRGKPYFIAFRPLKHSVERMPDDEIEQYNKYNDLIDDISYSLEQLEAEGVDVFDLKLELKLSLDKVKSGNFNMVQIYLDGLTPRIDKQWEKLGKKPKKYERKVVDDAALKADLAKAQEERAKFEADQKAKGGEQKEEKKEWGWKDNVAPDKLLSLKNGMIVLNLASLYDEISAMKDKDWEQEVDDKHNNVADWVDRATGMALLAANMRLTKDKNEYLKLLDLVKTGKKLPEIKPAAPSPTAAVPAAPLPAAAAAPAGAGAQQQAPTTPQAPTAQPSGPPPSIPPAAGTAAVPATDGAQQAAVQAPVAPASAQGLESLVAKPGEEFDLSNGVRLRSARELIEYLPKMDDETFRKYVTETENRFADWVGAALHDEGLAARLRQARTREQLMQVMRG